jgi:hypothetical protein
VVLGRGPIQFFDESNAMRVVFAPQRVGKQELGMHAASMILQTFSEKSCIMAAPSGVFPNARTRSKLREQASLEMRE